MTEHNEYGVDELEARFVQGKIADDLVLCYLICPVDAGGGFPGAILLTDSRTRPLHFAMSHPVKPTKLQRVLYGSTLDEYIKVDVIANKLWQGLPRKPDVLFVETNDLLVARRIANIPTAQLSKAGDAEGQTAALSNLKFDIGRFADDQESVGSILAALESTCDLVDPFRRAREALTESLKTGG